MKSIWTEGVGAPRLGRLSGNESTDVLIVGGGIAGILCAYKLKKAGIRCLLVEADEICGGTTGYTTAKITLSHGLIYRKLIKRFGEDKARLYAEAQQRAIGEYRELASKIDCGFAERDNYVYSLNDKGVIDGELAALRTLGIDAEFSLTEELPFKTAGAVRLRRQAALHPLKLLYSLAAELPIYTHTKVRELMPQRAITDRGEISFKRLVVATHFPILNKHGLYPLKLFQHRSYVLALKGAQFPSGMYVDGSGKGLSFRPEGEVLLLGSGGHRTGKRSEGWSPAERIARKYYEDAEEVARWATQDCMTLDGVPYIGQYSPATPNVYVITGFNKWGMTNAMVGAGLITDLVRGKQSRYTSVFTPKRSILRPALAKNALESVLGLLTPTLPRCPHLGCALKYNRAEHSWDCPCHGSRFTEEGELIENPATDDLKGKRCGRS